MKKSTTTYLKRPTKDNINRSANPPVTRASTILFNTMQEMNLHEKKIQSHKEITHYTYGRYGSTTTIALENIIKDLEQAYHVFLTGTGFGGISLALMSLCRPGDEIIVSDNVYGPTKEITEDLLKEFNIIAKFYNPEKFEDLHFGAGEDTRNADPATQIALDVLEKAGFELFNYQPGKYETPPFRLVEKTIRRFQENPKNREFFY